MKGEIDGFAVERKAIKERKPEIARETIRAEIVKELEINMRSGR